MKNKILNLGYYLTNPFLIAVSVILVHFFAPGFYHEISAIVFVITLSSLIGWVVKTKDTFVPKILNTSSELTKMITLLSVLVALYFGSGYYGNFASPQFWKVVTPIAGIYFLIFSFFIGEESFSNVKWGSDASESDKVGQKQIMLLMLYSVIFFLATISLLLHAGSQYIWIPLAVAFVSINMCVCEYVEEEYFSLKRLASWAAVSGVGIGMLSTLYQFWGDITNFFSRIIDAVANFFTPDVLLNILSWAIFIAVISILVAIVVWISRLVNKAYKWSISYIGKVQDTTTSKKNWKKAQAFVADDVSEISWYSFTFAMEHLCSFEKYDEAVTSYLKKTPDLISLIEISKIKEEMSVSRLYCLRQTLSVLDKRFKESTSDELIRLILLKIYTMATQLDPCSEYKGADELRNLFKKELPNILEFTNSKK